MNMYVHVFTAWEKANEALCEGFIESFSLSGHRSVNPRRWHTDKLNTSSEPPCCINTGGL